MRYFRTPALELVERLTGLGEFEKYRVVSAFHERLTHAPDLVSAWADTPAPQLTDGDRQVVDEFMAAFGKTDLAGQRDVCAGAADRLRRQREEAAEAGMVNIGLEGLASIGALVGFLVCYVTGSNWLGLLCGALIAVVLI